MVKCNGVDVQRNDILRKAYALVPENARLCLATLAEIWKVTKPFVGKKVLFNCHLTCTTLTMIDLLLLAGADLTVTSTAELTAHKHVLEVLRAANVEYIPIDKLTQRSSDECYDVMFDCGAGLLHIVQPRLGTAELTYTDPVIYNGINHIVITADESNTKRIETHYGTGDGFVRALKKLLADDDKILLGGKIKQRGMHQNNLQPSLFQDQKYIIFGYGKVGKGIAWALQNAGLSAQNIVVVDSRQSACDAANLAQHRGILLEEKNLPKIKTQIQQAFCVVTATGSHGGISEYFEREDFPKSVVLANMGTPDEWGRKFKKTEVLNEKKALNFSLEYPTEMIYLDPIFKTLLLAGELIVKEKMRPGLKPLPKDIDRSVMEEWQSYRQKKYRVDAI